MPRCPGRGGARRPGRSPALPAPRGMLAAGAPRCACPAQLPDGRGPHRQLGLPAHAAGRAARPRAHHRHHRVPLRPGEHRVQVRRPGFPRGRPSGRGSGSAVRPLLPRPGARGACSEGPGSWSSASGSDQAGAYGQVMATEIRSKPGPSGWGQQGAWPSGGGVCDGVPGEEGAGSCGSGGGPECQPEEGCGGCWGSRGPPLICALVWFVLP